MILAETADTGDLYFLAPLRRYCQILGTSNENDNIAALDNTECFSHVHREKMGMQSGIKDALPFAVMVVVECIEIGMATLSKAAMNRGMSKFVFVVYYNALGTLILLPHFIFHIHRSKRPPLTFSLLCRFFLLGLTGTCLLQISAFMGINYSSPTLASAMGNLIPAFTFLLAIIFRMEKLDLRTSSSRAKSLGTAVAISGAFMMTLYKGPPILMGASPSHSPHQLLLLQQSNWILGGLFLTITCFLSSTWNIFQTATVKEYPDKVTVVFFYCCFGTIQCAILSLIVERNPSAWMLRPGIEMITVLFSAIEAIFGCAFRTSVFTWCLDKKGPLFVAMFKPMGMVIAVIMGLMFLGDTLHLGSLIGAFIIAVGFYTVIWGQAKEKDTVADNFCRLESSTPKTPLLQNSITQKNIGEVSKSNVHGGEKGKEKLKVFLTYQSNFSFER
ncbi:hypothetical protein F0562_004971 [Nyssa sinensis]|uniref:EamA domain-containing protein n=1 Tax=Nyssa sinensis TaxID=561372 RepID=A0A5J5AKE9_9ASTE|nr:hypothetical protein F0562_004971 [Nyssa sinensis]